MLAPSLPTSDRGAQTLLSHSLSLTSPAPNSLPSKAKGSPNPRLSGLLTLVALCSTGWCSGTAAPARPCYTSQSPVFMAKSHCCQDVNIISFGFARGKRPLLHNVDPWGTCLPSPWGFIICWVQKHPYPNYSKCEVMSRRCCKDEKLSKLSSPRGPCFLDFITAPWRALPSPPKLRNNTQEASENQNWSLADYFKTTLYIDNKRSSSFRFRILATHSRLCLEDSRRKTSGVLVSWSGYWLYAYESVHTTHWDVHLWYLHFFVCLRLLKVSCHRFHWFWKLTSCSHGSDLALSRVCVVLTIRVFLVP